MRIRASSHNSHIYIRGTEISEDINIFFLLKAQGMQNTTSGVNEKSYINAKILLPFYINFNLLEQLCVDYWEH